MNFISQRLCLLALLSSFAVTAGFAQTPQGSQTATQPTNAPTVPQTPQAVTAPSNAATAAQTPQMPSANNAAAANHEGTSIAIVIDDSESARKQFDDLRDGVLAFVHSFGEEDELCLIGVGGKPHLLHELTYDPTLIGESVRKVHPQGAPDLASALQFAKQQLQSEAENDKTAIVMFVGNQPNGNLLTSASQAEAKIPVDVIAAPGADWQMQEKLQELTSNSGGRSYFPPSDRQFKEVAAATGKRLTATKEQVAIKQSRPEPQWPRGRKLLASFQELEIHSIPVADNKDTEQFMGGDNLLLQRVLVERFRRAKLFPSVVDGSATQAAVTNTNATEAAPPGKKLEMRATLIKYDRGSRMRRQFTFGGDARMTLQVDLVDAGTGEEVESFATEGSAYVGGVFGGSQESVLAKAMLDVANSVMKEIRRQR